MRTFFSPFFHVAYKATGFFFFFKKWIKWAENKWKERERLKRKKREVAKRIWKKNTQTPNTKYEWKMMRRRKQKNGHTGVQCMQQHQKYIHPTVQRTYIYSISSKSFILFSFYLDIGCIQTLFTMISVSFVRSFPLCCVVCLPFTWSCACAVMRNHRAKKSCPIVLNEEVETNGLYISRTTAANNM